jgi:hypothetical protein
MPFIPFPKQVDLVGFVLGLTDTEDDGLIEKSRDMGATWVCSAISVWMWLYTDGSSIGWGSRKEQLVDKLGDPDSIFEKIRMLIRSIPWYCVPKGFNEKTHLAYMKCINPANESTITGEAGDNIGRGGRSSIYFKDEALTLASRVLTISGWKLMGELTVEDRVMAINGEAQDVTHINDCGSFDTYQVGFSDGTSVDCSPNHLWTLNDVIGKRKQVTIRTTEMLERFKYTSPKGRVQYRFRLPLIDPVKFKKAQLPLHPYVVGALIGDGGVSQVPKNSPKLTSIDDEIVVYFKKCLPDYCTMTKEKGITYRLGDVRGRMGWKHKSRIRTVLVDIGLAGKRSWEKSIPDAYKFASVSDRIGLLQGLMDTDGSAGRSGGTASYYTSSKQLADDVRFIAESLGGYATMRVKKDRRGYRDQYVLYVVLPGSINPFRLTRKLDIYAKRKNTIERSVVSVKKTGEKEPVRCITVSSQDGLYLTEGCIPTHNSAHYERPELIEASLGDNTNVQVDISSVCGEGTVFHRKRMSDSVKHFIMDWRDHPAKTQEWYDKRKAKALDGGLGHVFAQEVDRDYGAAVEGVFIPAEWVRASIDAHIKLGFEPVGEKRAGLDVADEGSDKNALIAMYGQVITHIDQWSEGDTSETAKKAWNYSIDNNLDRLVYDSVGVGAGVKGKTRELSKLEQFQGIRLSVEGFSAGSGVVNPDKKFVEGKKNKDMFKNVKAQTWWAVRQRFHDTFKAVAEGKQIPHERLISIPSSLKMATELVSELSRPKRESDEVGRIIVESKKKMAKRGIKSPNLADSLIMCYAPIVKVQIHIG